MQSVRYRLTAMIAVALVALAGGQARAAFIDLTPPGNASNSMQSIKLSDLVSQEVEGIVVGDKIFTGFSYLGASGNMPPVDDVNVTGFRDPNGHWGITFQGAFSDLPTDNTASDVAIRFMVEIDPAFAAQGWRINDAHLFLSGAGASDNSYFAVDESFLGLNETMSVEYSTLNAGNVKLSDWVYFANPTTKLTVTKDIYAFADPNSTAPARATVIDQSFSQILIPEPSTILLTGFALTAFGLFGYRHQLSK